MIKGLPPRATSQETKAKSQEPSATSREPTAKSQEPRAESHEPSFFFVLYWTLWLLCAGRRRATRAMPVHTSSFAVLASAAPCQTHLRSRKPRSAGGGGSCGGRTWDKRHGRRGKKSYGGWVGRCWARGSCWRVTSGVQPHV